MKNTIEKETGTQKILEDVLFEAYNGLFEGTGNGNTVVFPTWLLETDNKFGYMNLFTLMAKRIRKWLTDENGDIFQLVRKNDEHGPNNNWHRRASSGIKAQKIKNKKYLQEYSITYNKGKYEK